ncbi:fungal hydrophobin-domain-containing protein [Crucibulum laeve]|uniref:Hydrophobin n=1 Tax=Crucibulum laeve TaxID=68775 RepID=A0A5C3LYK4_9AGAR|nr:fungal hydrophobin-domain-containing protein [Crucibulum laeve]
MFSKVALLATASLAIFAAASPIAEAGSNQCSTGTVQCCNSFQDAKSAQVTSLLSGLAGVDVGAITGQVGVECNPISVIGAGFNSCKAQTACCTGNNFNGAVVVGCSPISAL